jgi:hypothetical protein
MGDGCRRMRAVNPCAFAKASPDSLRYFANLGHQRKSVDPSIIFPSK